MLRRLDMGPPGGPIAVAAPRNTPIRAKRRAGDPPMKLAVPKEIRPGERRVAATPESVARLLKLGFEVLVESQAGAGAFFGDDDYAAAGATVVNDTQQLWQLGDIVLKVQPPDLHPTLNVHEADLLRQGA